MLSTVFQVAALILASTAMHGVASAFLVRTTDQASPLLHGPQARLRRFFFVPVRVLFMLLVGVLEAGVWAWYYFRTDQIATFSESLYFSLVTMTTVGYGDVTLEGAGRIISGIQAALGIVLFGWTTSIIFGAVQ